MKKKREVLAFKRSINISVSKEQYGEIYQGYCNSTCYSLSEYIKKVFFNTPITTYYRNQSADELIVEMTRLKRELWEIRQVFDRQLQAFCTVSSIEEMELWARVQEKSKRILFDKIEEVRLLMVKKYDLCTRT